MDTLLKTSAKTFSMVLVGVTLAFFTAGCGSPDLTPRETATIAGGMLGAGTGALIGSVLSPVGPAIGAGIGGGLGLVAGAGVGDEIQIGEAENDQTNKLLGDQQKDLEEQRREMQELRDREERDEGQQSQTQSRSSSTYEHSMTVTP
jgi:phage tail tape-measure protein